MDMRNKYTVKVIGKQQVIDSKVVISLDESCKISKLQDRWNGNIPDSAIAQVRRYSSDFRSQTHHCSFLEEQAQI